MRSQSRGGPEGSSPKAGPACGGASSCARSIQSAAPSWSRLSASSRSAVSSLKRGSPTIERFEDRGSALVVECSAPCVGCSGIIFSSSCERRTSMFSRDWRSASVVFSGDRFREPTISTRSWMLASADLCLRPPSHLSPRFVLTPAARIRGGETDECGMRERVPRPRRTARTLNHLLYWWGIAPVPHQHAL